MYLQNKVTLRLSLLGSTSLFVPGKHCLSCLWMYLKLAMSYCLALCPGAPAAPYH